MNPAEVVVPVNVGIVSPSLAVETDRYLAVSAKLNTEDIAWEDGAEAGLSADEVFILTYFSDIESQTIMYLRELLGSRAANESDVLAFLTMWNYEEFFHGKALAQLLEICGHPLEKDRIARVRKTASFSEWVESFGAMVLSKIFAAEFPAVHAAWGAVQEITTLRGYEELARLTPNPVLKTLCERIAKQERRHFAWYFNSAKSRLLRSERARRLTRFLLSRFWSPVGAGVKSPAEVARLIGLIFPGDTAQKVAREIDAKIGTLPGLAGIGLMVPYMAKAAGPRLGA